MFPNKVITVGFTVVEWAKKCMVSRAIYYKIIRCLKKYGLIDYEKTGDSKFGDISFVLPFPKFLSDKARKYEESFSKKRKASKSSKSPSKKKQKK